MKNSCRSSVARGGVILLLHLIVAAAFSASEPGPQMPAAIYDIWRVNPSPRPGQAATVNPPILKWPYAEGNQPSYLVELSSNPDFAGKDVIRSREQAWTVFNPHRKLESGTWYWRVAAIRDGKKSWSPVYSFDLNDQTPVFVVPDVETLLTNLPAQRPYIMAFGQAHKQVMDNAKPMPHLCTEIIAESRRALEAEIIDFDKFDKSTVTPRRLGGLYSKQKQQLEPLCRGYLITGESCYYEAAQKRVREMLKWSTDDEMAIADTWRRLSMFYDTFYSLLPADLKTTLLDRSSAYLDQNYRTWAGKVENRQIENHFLAS